MKGLLRFLFPGGAVLLAAAVAIRFLDDAALEIVTGRYGIALYAAGAALAAVFHRSRVVAALVGLAGLGLVGAGGVEAGRGAFVPLATTLMVLVGILALLRDRGVLARGGVVQVVGSCLIGVAAYVVFRDAARVADFQDAHFLPTGLRVAAEFVPEATAVLGTAALAAVLYGVYRWRGPVERALLWCALSLGASVLPSVAEAQASFLLMAAGLVLAISVLETSYFMAYRDELTGLPARRALVRDLEQIAGKYTVAMVDVDHFKKFNDKYGHDVGDQVLQLVASRLTGGPGGGKAYRYGGEEFTLLYPGRVKDEAFPYAESVRRSVEISTFSLRAWNRPRKKPVEGKKPKTKKRPKKLSVTVSVGLADSVGESNPEAALKRADEALYQAKRGGRNRVTK
jgi:diguanylate cyclase (GGDEF)-like protein